MTKTDTDIDRILFHDGTPIHTSLKNVDVERLRRIVKVNSRVTAAEIKSRAKIYTTISTASAANQDSIRTAVEAEVSQGHTKYKRKATDIEGSGGIEPPSKRVHIEGGSTSNDPATLELRENGEPLSSNNHSTEIDNLIHNSFLVPPTDTVVNACIQKYIDATSLDMLKMHPCASCARELFEKELSFISLPNVPNQHRLKPHTPHPHHILINGMLLYHPSLRRTESHDSVDAETISSQDTDIELGICVECFRALESGTIPKLSLANDMWIGDQPRELTNLSLPERVLIGKYFPAAYIFKLYPKMPGARTWGDERQMHSGLKGNVSTYRLDPKLVADLVTGRRMPNPAQILSATIGVTFIGPKGLTERSMPRMFRVRREVVRKALVWLRENNPLYSDIEICRERLEMLPDNGVPVEILGTVRYSSDIEAVQREHAGVAPSQDEVEELLEEAGLSVVDDDNDMEVDEREDVDPDIIPIEALGNVDMEGHDISRRELMSHALSNTAMRNLPEDFSVQRGSAFVNEYARLDPLTGLRNDGGPSNPNHLLGSFPTLFPYGRGGFETNRPISVPYELHARWALQYADRRFRKDPQFPFQVFGVIQKRQTCRSAVLQIKKGAFAKYRNLLASLTSADLIKASEEETRKIRFSNPAVRALRNQLTAVRTRVPGTDESRHSIRSKIWGTNMIFNLAAVWLTLNPPDTQDPIAQIFCGEEIDFDAFSKTAGPDSKRRAANIAADPKASAHFFHFTIQTFIETLMRITKKRNHFEREEGILGIVQAYIGTVEAQARGSLHLHMLIWLKDAPPPSVMRQALKSTEFRDKIRHYIRNVIHSDIRGLPNDDVQKLPKATEVSYSRPINPATHPVEAQQRIEELARTLQLHKCSKVTCIREINKVRVCKRRAPFTLAIDAWVDEFGNWGSKRLCQFLNGWCPPIMHTIRANHDLKLMLNGDGTFVVSYYITNYTTKKQGRSSNTSALLAKTILFHRAKERLEKDAQRINKLLIQRCGNALSRDREFSAPEVISYLMGWGDRYESHHYVSIYWDGAASALTAAYPGLCVQRSYSGDLTEASEGTIISFVDGQISMRDNLRDYTLRSNDLADMNFFDFVINTYDGKAITQVERNTEEDEEIDILPETMPSLKRGRPPNTRFPYLQGADKANRCRVLRTAGHETLPRFVGRWFPRADDPAKHELYCAHMLMLLKPWRSLEDLKQSAETFKNSYADFISTSTNDVKRIVDNIQYYHLCADAAHERRKEKPRERAPEYLDLEIEEEERVRIEDEDDHAHIEAEEITEDDIEAARRARIADRDYFYGTSAIEVAKDAGIFEDDEGCATNQKAICRAADEDELEKFAEWDRQLKKMVNDGQNTGEANTDMEDIIIIHQGHARPPALTNQNHEDKERPLHAMLNEEQRRAHDIIEEVLIKELQGLKPPQLLMMILGQGGVGKSMLIEAITETFAHHEAKEKLAKCATTGIAASGIGGKTVHSWAGLQRGGKMREADKNSPTFKKRVKNIINRLFAIVDEISMADKTTLYNLSETISATRSEEGEGDLHLPFGGMHMVICGDFHQFPPVGNKTGALYCEGERDSAQAKLGKEIYQQFNTVVILRQQIRVKDEQWTHILNRLRVGECTDEDLEEIRSLVLPLNEKPHPDFSTPPWSEVILVTPRHTVREMWNAAALRKHCNKTGNRQYRVKAEDTIRVSGEKPPPAVRLQIAKSGNKATEKLKEEIGLAIGMKAMVVMNLATEADIANGTRGTIVDIILDHRDENPDTDEEGRVILEYPPACIIFKPDGKCNARFEGLDEGLVPIVPSAATFNITVDGKSYSIKRRQLAMTEGYAFTDYKAQGQTIEYVIIDIGKPPQGELSPFSVYVALSRSRGRETIRLLRDFDDTLFTHHPSEELRVEMQRLEELDRLTTERYM